MSMHSRKMLSMGGDVKYDPDPSDISVGERGVIEERTGVEAKLRMYSHADDKVIEFEVEGAAGRTKALEPSLEDRAFISAQMICSMLYDNQLDVHDFKQIVEWALQGLSINLDQLAGEDKEAASALFDKLDKIDHELGGPG